MKELKSSLQSEYFLVIQWIQCEYGTLASFHFLDIWFICCRPSSCYLTHSMAIEFKEVQN